jgi:hypothetical protein
MAIITRNGTAGTWTAANTGIWSTATVPTSSDDVIFTSTSANTPIAAGITVNCKSLTLDSSFTGTIGNSPGTGETIAIAGKNGAGNSLDISGGQIYPCDVRLDGTTASNVNLSGVNTEAKATFSLLPVGAGPHTLSSGSTGAFVNSLVQSGGTFSTNNCNLTISNLVINAGTATFGSSTITIKSFNSVSTQLFFGTSGLSAPNATFNYTDTAINCTLGYGSPSTTIGTLNISSSTGVINGQISCNAVGPYPSNFVTVANLSITSTGAGSRIGFKSVDGLAGGNLNVTNSISITGAYSKLLTIASDGDDGFGPVGSVFWGTPAYKNFRYLDLSYMTVFTSPPWSTASSVDSGNNLGWVFNTTVGFFDTELNTQGWFDKNQVVQGWFDEILIPYAPPGPVVSIAYTLIADPGNYTITGAPATLSRSIPLNAAAGSYTITGAPATLSRSIPLNAAAGSYTITGAPATLSTSLNLNAAAGSYAITGAPATLSTSLNLNAAAGSYTITGAPATLSTSLNLNAAAGSYAITGAAATLSRGINLNAAAGSYAITGAPATLSTSLNLNAAAGSYAITGAPATFLLGTSLSADPGSYAITGAPATFIASANLSADPGSYTITGAPVEFIITGWRVIDANQTPSWTPVNDTQTGIWVDVDDAQTPNWTQIAA